MKFLFRLLFSALTLLLATNLIEGVVVESFYFALIAAIVIGLLNAIVRPLLLLLTFPVTILTLGLSTFVINALLIWFASSFLQGFEVMGFLPALLLAIILWIVGTLVNWLITDKHE